MKKPHQSLLGTVLCLVYACGASAADPRTVSFDAGSDFHSFKTFAILTGHVDTRKPEIDNRLFRQRMEDELRATLTAKGLKEVSGQPDLSVTYSVADANYSDVERTPALRIPPVRVRGQGQVVPGTVIPGGPRPALSTESTLIIDLTDGSNKVVWRGICHDTQDSAPTLSRNLSENARKLLDKYPPKK